MRGCSLLAVLALAAAGARAAVDVSGAVRLGVGASTPTALRLDGGWKETWTRADGSFTFFNVPEGAADALGRGGLRGGRSGPRRLGRAHRASAHRPSPAPSSQASPQQVSPVCQSLRASLLSCRAPVPVARRGLLARGVAPSTRVSDHENPHQRRRQREGTVLCVPRRGAPDCGVPPPPEPRRAAQLLRAEAAAQLDQHAEQPPGAHHGLHARRYVLHAVEL